MTLIMMEGFDHYDTGQFGADIIGKWAGYANPGYIETSGRTGQCFSNDHGIYWNACRLRTHTWSWRDEIVLGFAIKIDLTQVTSSGVKLLAVFYDDADVLCALAITSGGMLEIWETANTSGSPQYTGTKAVLSNIWQYIEVKVKFGDGTAGEVAFQVNGVDAGSTTGIDTVYAGYQCTALSIGGYGWGNSYVQGPVVWIDDLYICDTAGSENNDFLGDVEVRTKFPTSDVSIDSTPSTSGASAYEMIDESAPDDDSTYNTLAASNDEDLLGFDSIGAVGSVHAVQVNIRTREENAGDGPILASVKSGGTIYHSGNLGISTDYINVYAVFEDDPDTGSPWSGSGVDSADFGYERS